MPFRFSMRIGASVLWIVWLFTRSLRLQCATPLRVESLGVCAGPRGSVSGTLAFRTTRRCRRPASPWHTHVPLHTLLTAYVCVGRGVVGGTHLTKVLPPQPPSRWCRPAWAAPHRVLPIHSIGHMLLPGQATA
uniref:Secreted protein n=1 Tax=Eutreptiella gymnastica TaxID=73025 RepID=A0A7S4D2I5_9EUGL